MNSTFNNEKWDFWASAISAVIEASKDNLPDQIRLFAPLVDSRGMVLVRLFQQLRQEYDRPLPLDSLEAIAPADVAIIMMITNEYYGKPALTYSSEGLKLSKEIAG